MKMIRTSRLVLLYLFTLYIPVFSQDSKPVFTIETEVKTTAVKDQAKSGTCWAFAGISFIETELIRMGKGEHDLSELYVVRNIYPLKSDNYIRLHGNANLTSGGQAHDVLNAISGFGIVPEGIYPGLNYGMKLHDHMELDDQVIAVTKQILANKGKSASEIGLKPVNSILDMYLGSLPFEFSYNGKEYTPKSLSESLGIVPVDYIEITSYSNYPYYKNCMLQIPDNWSYDHYFNVPLDELMAIIDHALKKGFSVCWDGDVSGDFSKSQGIAMLPEEKVIVTQELRQKAFDNFQSTDDHLMHITGIAHDQNGRKYYLTKNSWGKDSKYNGYWYMSEAFLRLNTVAIMIHKKALPEKISPEPK